MKRTNLVLDERLLAEATRVLAARTYSAAVNTALEEVIRVRKIRSIPRFFESVMWYNHPVVGGLSDHRREVAQRSRPKLPSAISRPTISGVPAPGGAGS